MSAQLKPTAQFFLQPQPRQAEAESRPAATVLPLRRGDHGTGGVVDNPAQDRLSPARGLIIGLCLGALLWVGIFALAWEFFR